MEKVYTSSGYSNQLLSQMSVLWRESRYCDAILNIQDERLKLHKLVLMAACPNILRCLAHTEENNIFEFYLPEDIEKSAVRQIVNYLYIGSIHLNIANVYGIEKLAKQLRLCALSQFCHDFISLLELETNGQSLLLPGINQQIIPKQETTEVEKVEDPKSEDTRSKSTTAMLTEISTSFLPQLTDGFEQLPITSSSIKTELDTFMNPSLEETICVNREKSIVIDPLDNILQVSVSDNSITSAVATSVCKSWDPVSLDPHVSIDSLESPSVSHQTCTMGTQDQQFSSNQDQTNISLTPVLSMTACNPSISRSLGGEIDNMDLIVTAEDEDFEDSGDEWVPHGDDSSDLDDCLESSPNRSTETKRKMATKGPKLKRSKKDTQMTAKKKMFRVDKMTPADIKKLGGSRNFSISSGLPMHLSNVDAADKTNNLHVSYKLHASSDCPDAKGIDHICRNANILNNTETQIGKYARQEKTYETAPQSVTKTKSSACIGKMNSNLLKSARYNQVSVNEKRMQNIEGRSIDTESLCGTEDKTKQMVRKLKIVEHAEIYGMKSAAEVHNITEDIIQDWILLKNHFTKKTREIKKLALTPKHKKFIKIGEHTDLEDTVMNWLIKTKYSPGISDDVTIIQKKSVEIATEIGKPDVNIGDNWVKQILEKYIRNIKVDTNNATFNIFNSELREKVRDYAKLNGVKTAAEHFNLPQETVACWKRDKNRKDAPDIKSTRKRYKFNFKLDAVKCAEQVGNNGAARVYGVSEKNIRDWRKQKDHLKKYEENRLGIKRSVTRPYSLIESLLENWIQDEKRRMTIEEIRTKALLFAEQTSTPEFKASNSWCMRFLKLYNVLELVK